ncbi:MAG TPA: DUF3047 domain-containing protein [Gammaproteobacteria bacterium]|nr:DUF3047 domain-containing protein [Gammaproteobacteria bacterium]
MSRLSARRRRAARPALGIIAALAVSLTVAADARVPVGNFSGGSLSGWSDKVFMGHTDYSLVTFDGRTALKAVSQASASGLYKEVHVDLRKTPYLHWSWRIDHTLGDLRERTTGGDDYPARVYVVFSGGVFFWRTQAINYVWSSNQPPGSTWKNAFTDNARMVAVQSGPGSAGRWISERRDVRRDYHRLFDGDAHIVDAVAIMTDTDNSGKSATAYYGDIWFAAQ